MPMIIHIPSPSTPSSGVVRDDRRTDNKGKSREPSPPMARSTHMGYQALPGTGTTPMMYPSSTSASGLDIITLCESIIGETFTNKLKCIEALQTSGCTIFYESHMHNIPNNDRLAVLGDTMLDFVLCMPWYETGCSKKKWTHIRDDIASNKNLARIGRATGLDQCIIKHPGHTGEVSDKMMATTVEAIIGAIVCEYTTRGDGDGRVKAVSRVARRLGLEHVAAVGAELPATR